MERMLKTLGIIVTVTATSLLTVEAQSSNIVCPVNNQLFLSVDRDLLPLSNVRATSEHTLFNPTENFISDNNPPWCSELNIQDVNPRDHYVEVNFTEPVVITLLESSGLVNGYVNNFMIEYASLEDPNEVHLYGVTESPQEFRVESILLTDQYFTLERPIVAQNFKFRINDAVLDQDGRICWEILMYGCTLNSAQVLTDSVQTQSTTQSTTMPTTTTDTTTTVEDTEGMECPSVASGTLENRLDKDLLTIVLPIALVAIVIMLVIVIAGVVVCLLAAKRKQAKEPNYETVTVRMLNNRTQALTGAMETDHPKDSLSFHYDSPRLLSYDVPRMTTRSRPTSTGSTDHLSSTFEIKNPIYSLKRSHSAGANQRHDSYTADDSNDYEMIPEALPGKEGIQVPLVPQSSRSHDINERSHDNPPDLPPNQPHTYSVVDKNKKAQERAEKEGRKTNTHSNLEEPGSNEKSKDYNRLAKMEGTNPMFRMVPEDKDICKDKDTP